MIERRAEVSSDSSQLDVPPPPRARSIPRAAVLVALAVVGSATLIQRADAWPLCSNATYAVTWCETPCPRWPDPEMKGCQLKQAYYCADGEPYLGDDTPSCSYEYCPLGVCFDSFTTECSDPYAGLEDTCGDGLDNDGNGCAEEGCVKGEPPCECDRKCDTYACGNIADCDPRAGKKERCDDDEDNDCDGAVNEDCEPKQQCQATVGADPIVLTNRSVVTEPFTDFSVEAQVPLSLSRTWSSMSISYFGGPTGVLGRGWQHDWNATLSCDGASCTVLRGSLEGYRLHRAEAALSLDGTETWQLYRPGAEDETASRRQLLARRPTGEWILFEADGTVLHFATVCDACGVADRFCTAPEAGGVARLVKKVDARGSEVHVHYARSEGLLLGLTDALGHSLELRSDTACADGLARGLFYDGVRVVTYAYDGADLLSATDSDGATLRAYAYDPSGSGLLVAVIDEAASPIVEFAYDQNGDAAGIVDERTSAWIAYPDDGTVSVWESFGLSVMSGQRTIDPSGKVVSVSEGCACGSAQTFTYDGRDLVCAKDAQGTYTYDGRDSLGRVVRHARYQGSACPPSASPLAGYYEEEWRTYGVQKPIAQGVSLELDLVTSTSRTSTLSSLNKASESWDYDPAPKAIDPVGYACTEAPLPAGAVICRQILTGYVKTPTNTVVSERHATFYSYDGRGRLTKTVGPVNLDYPSASDVVPVEERSYWPDTETLARRGRLGEVRRYPSPTAAPLATTYDYDLFGLYRSWQPDGRFTTWLKDGRGRARFVLESDGRTSETRYHDGEKPRLQISASGEVTRTGYDSRGRIIAEERLSADPDAPGATVTVLWGEHHAYDPAGNRVHSERRDGTGTVVWKQDREFDVQHRLVKESHPEVAGAARSWEYDPAGFLTRTVDEEGRATTFLPEYVGRVKSVTRSGLDASGAPVSLAVATYGYQSYSGSLATVMDGKGITTAYRHDDFGRLEQIIQLNFKGGAKRSYWDARGNLLKRNDFYYYVTESYTYDGLDRALTATVYNSADKATVSYAYRYDEAGAKGRLTSVVEPERTVRFTFDVGGRLATERLEENGVAAPLVTEYRRAPDGALSEMVYPTGLRLAHDRDPATRQVTALRNVETGELYASGVNRLGGGPVASATYANGATLLQDYNARWEPLSVATGPVSLQYTPTPAGDVGQIVESGLTLPFRYDFLDRLAESPGWFSYGHDGNGNRTSEWLEGAPLAYGYTNDRVKDASTPGTTPVKRFAFAYDVQTNLAGIGRYNAAGSLVEKAMCLRHDPLGRLVLAGATATVTPDGGACNLDTQVTSVTARFKYDFRNRRVASWRAETGEWVYTVFDQGGQPLAELALTTDPAKPWRPVREYVWLDGKPVAQIEHDPVTGAARTYAVHVDAIGLPRALTSPTGATVWRASVARPYGDVTEATVPDPETGRTVVTNLRLPGQYDERLLASVGLQGPYYNWNRWYLPGVGRYLELDPIAREGDFNAEYGADWYGYADANPLRFTDFDGRSKTQGIGGDDPAQRELKEAAKRGRDCVTQVAKKWEQLRKEGSIGAERWRWIKGWIKVAKRGDFGLFPFLNLTPLCGPNLECIKNSPNFGYPDWT